MLRVKTLLQVSELRNLSLNLNMKCLNCTNNMLISLKNLNSVTKTFRIWNLLLKKVNYTFFKPVTVKELLLLPLKLPLICMKRVLLQKKELFSWLIHILLTRFCFLALMQKLLKKLTRFVTV